MEGAGSERYEEVRQILVFLCQDHRGMLAREPLAGEGLAELLLSEDAEPSTFALLLEHLVSMGVGEAATLAAAWVRDEHLHRGWDGDRAVIAAHALLRLSTSPPWSLLVEALTSDGDFGERVLVRWDESGGPPKLVRTKSMTVSEHLALYQWMRARFPPGAYKRPKRAVGYGGHLAWVMEGMRDGLLESLGQLGTYEGIRALRSLLSEATTDHEQSVLAYALSTARTNVQPAAARALTVEEVVGLLADPARRLARTEE